MSEDTKKLKTLLQKLRLIEYFKNFQEVNMLYSDLDCIDEEELEEVIPKKFHRRRLLNHFESLKGSGKAKEQELRRDEPRRSEKADKEEEDGEFVQMLVKWDEQVVKVYDVPLEISNEELIGKLMQEFVTCKIKLQGEERMLVKESKRFNLKKWFGKSGMREEDTIRAVLKVEGEVVEGVRDAGEVEKLKMEIEKLEGAVGERDKSLKERGQELKKRGLMLKKRDETIEKLEKTVGERDGQLKKREEAIGKLRRENEVLKEKVKAKESRPGRVEMEQATLTTTTSSGIVIPKIRFVENRYTSGVFSNGNKRAKSNKDKFIVFKGNYVFKVGKKYYFQAKYKKSCYTIGLGVLQGEVQNKQLGCRAKGWECYCYCPFLYRKGTTTSTNYGPKRKESASVGVLVDFTNGKRELSFFFDGKNCGVAFRDVEPPVSPAFYVYGITGDTWEIEDVKELPKGM